MEDTIASLLLETVYENLKSKAIDSVRQAWEMDDEVENLSSTLSAIQAVLEDAEEKQIESKPVKDWLRKLKAVAYDADDVVDEFANEAQRPGLQGIRQGKSRKVMATVFSFANSTLSSLGWKGETFQQNIARRINEIRERLDQIADEQKKFHLQPRERARRREISLPRETTSSVDERIVFGRDEEREEIVGAMVSDCSSGRQIPVVALVGMGGLGKTTLAQLVFNNPRVKNYFERCAWVCVSDDFDLKRLTREIIESATGEPCMLSSLDSMQRKLQNELGGKRFLIVLDDVWNKNSSYWEQLRTPFIAGARGSKILVTTRDESVSSVMGATLSRKLKGLSDDGCWALFKRKASIDENIASHPAMLLIKEKVVNRCQGLPLAVKALGGLLYTKDVSEWNGILDSEIWNLPGDTSDVLPVLRLSYHHLPTNLKQCFAFCSMYPKDYEFEKGELVQLWISEGFVQAREGKQIEDTGSEHFDELLLRSFLQHSTSNGLHVMHDLIHDLALFISSSEYFALASGKTCNVPKAARHLSFICSSGTKSKDLEALHQALHQELHQLMHLRTFLVIYGFKTLQNGERMEVPHDLFQKFRCLRVLDLSYANIAQLPDSIDGLKHLRYLNISYTLIEKFPESLSSICSLQTLKLECSLLVELPNDLKNLINLRHIHNRFTQMTLMPHGLGTLTNLQTLEEFIVGKDRGHGIEELKGLTGLRGIINIQALENVADAEAAKGACLKNKPHISELVLNWSSTHAHTLQAGMVEGVLDGLQPHRNLKVLKINSYNGTCFPSWMEGSSLLPHLVHLELSRCSKCSRLPPLGQLPLLKYLIIEGMDEVKCIGRELCGMENAFPLLEELQLRSLPNLEEWCGIEEGDFPRLHTLGMHFCGKLKQLPNLCLPALTHLNISGIEGLISLPHLPQSLQKLQLGWLANLEEWCSAAKAEFSFLHELLITNCPKMQTWPCLLPTLQDLEILSCQGFVGLPPLLPSLSRLALHECNERVLESLPHLTSITSLEIGQVCELTSLPRRLLQPLIQLKKLKIYGCQELISLLREDVLEDERLPSGLTSLEVTDCPKLNSLPRGLHFHSSMETLKISYCPQLSSLPEEGLPRTLQYLEIKECPTLKERCQQERGHDWPKIALIHHILIDDERILQDWSAFYSRVTVGEARTG